MRTYLTLALVIMIGIFSLWFNQDIQENEDNTNQASERFPDYFMDNFSITSMNDSGQPSTILSAKKLLHFADDDSAELEYPMIVFKQNGTNFTLQASRAVYKQEENLVHLYDNVVIQQTPEKTKSELFIYTDYLKIDIKRKIAENNRPSRVKTEDSELNAVGILLDNMQGKLILKSQIKGVYKGAH